MDAEGLVTYGVFSLFYIDMVDGVIRGHIFCGINSTSTIEIPSSTDQKFWLPDFSLLPALLWQFGKIVHQ